MKFAKTETKSDELTDKFIIEQSPASMKRWVALIFGSFSLFGGTYMYSQPTTLVSPIRSFYNINNTEYNYIYSIGQLGMLFMPLLGGYFCDLIGSRVVLMIGLTFVTIGQMLLYISAQTEMFWLLILGRFISMSFFDTVIIARYKMISNMFYGNQIATAIGIAAIFSKSGLIVNSFLTPAIYTSTNSLDITFLVCGICCCLSWISGLIFVIFDINLAEPKLRNSSILTLHENIHNVTFRDILKLKPIVWYLALCGGLTYGTMNALFDNVNQLVEDKFQFTIQNAGNLAGIFLITALIGIVIQSYLVAKKGMRSFLLLSSVCLLNIGVFIIQVIPDCDKCWTVLPAMLLTGWFLASYSVTIYPSIPFVVPKVYMGLAFGLLAIVNNLFLVSLPFGYGAILDSSENDNGTPSYTEVLYYVLSFSLVGMVVAIITDIIDKRLGRPLSQLKPNDTFKVDLMETQTKVNESK